MGITIPSNLNKGTNINAILKWKVEKIIKHELVTFEIKAVFF